MKGLTDTREALDLSHKKDLVGSFRKGGKVKRTGLAMVHKGEHVSSTKKEAKLRKKGMTR